MTPSSRGIPTANIRFQQVSPVVALSRRQPTVSLQKPATNTSQVTIDASSVSPGPSTQQGQISTSPNASSQQNVAQQPQHSPQQVRFVLKINFDKFLIEYSSYTEIKINKNLQTVSVLTSTTTGEFWSKLQI